VGGWIRHKAVKDVLLISFATVLALAGAELMIRIAARFSIDVRYLVTGRDAKPQSYSSLAEFLAEFRAQIVPHRNWNNYYANALGFTDREFSSDKPSGTFRVMALGDSFAYGLVGYPHNVLTLAESSLAESCGDPKVEIMNFGMPATGVWEYRWLHKLAAPVYRPDRVVIHFYMGNDGPNTFTGGSELPMGHGSRRFRSFAWNYLVNSVRLLWSVERPLSEKTAGTHRPARGGDRVSDVPDLDDRDRKPTFTEEVFASQAAAELGRLYSKPNRIGTEAWKQIFGVLNQLRLEVISSTGHPPSIVLYPSQLQVYPQVFEATIRHAEKLFPGATARDFDAQFPNRMMANYCLRTGVHCYDLTPSLMKATRQSSDPLYIPRDTHWNNRGNQIAASAEAAALHDEFCARR
jgi:hypothetical protein